MPRHARATPPPSSGARRGVTPLSAPPAGLPPSHRILLDHAERDLDEGLDFVRRRLREAASGRLALAERSLEAAIVAGLAALELRARLREDVAFLLRLADEVTAGADARKLAEENVARVLRLKELNLVVKVKDPAFQPVLDLCRESFARRLPDLARMAAVKDPADYDDLLRRAFPDRAVPERIVAENRELMVRVVEHAERNPQLLRMARGFVPRVAELAREVTEWKTEQVLRGIDEVYGPPDPASAAPV